MNYVVGFMIRPRHWDVLFIQKNRPAFQKGTYNGIGGKIEPNESPIDAMVREFREETGIHTQPFEWQHTVTVHGSDDLDVDRRPFAIYVFRNVVDEFPVYEQVTDERVGIAHISDVYPQALLENASLLPTLPNMKFILPLQFVFNVKFPIEFQHVQPH